MDMPKKLVGDARHGGPVHAFFLKPGTPRKPSIERGTGIYMWDTSGKRYVDACSGPVVNNLGHGNRRVLEAMRLQAEKVAFAYPSLFESPPNVALADLVTSLAAVARSARFRSPAIKTPSGCSAR
jgi:adenosylmethionine-8-amino-7-oxononanoate aminotransferase